ncbi:MAG TPA: metallophosphoesterase [Polyangiaceae bacterium]|jgi:hypothetical protein|nr:metallophosphoesterase [Polyangiaceae bacterium]
MKRGLGVAAYLAAAFAAACTRSVAPEPPGQSSAATSSVVASAATPVRPASVATSVPAASVATSVPPATPLPSSSEVHDADASYRFPAPARLVAIGDLHGDLAATRAALRLAHAVDDADRWIGGKLVVVQTGDELDRGDGDRAIVELFDRLADSAHAAGGEVRALVGNHEVMNVAGDFRYVTAGGFAAFADVDTRRVPTAILSQFPVEARGRLAAFFPGGPYALRLSRRNAVVVVGDTLFVHGGVTVDHVRYGIGRFNREVSRWMSGEGAAPALSQDEQGPLWTRRYSDDKAGVDCDSLGAALAALGIRRMVVGHTPHESGITPACGDRVWRIDTGMSKFYGGPLQVLEIQGDKTTVLHSDTRSP